MLKVSWELAFISYCYPIQWYPFVRVLGLVSECLTICSKSMEVEALVLNRVVVVERAKMSLF
uniref:Uncharacterized protein n=1 Tax=Arundo donax TaxID=35708 RepID=A0A0A9DPG7_ARUDO